MIDSGKDMNNEGNLWWSIISIIFIIIISNIFCRNDEVNNNKNKRNKVKEEVNRNRINYNKTIKKINDIQHSYKNPRINSSIHISNKYLFDSSGTSNCKMYVLY